MFLQRFQTLGHHTDHTPRTDPTRSVGLRLGQRGIIIGRNRVMLMCPFAMYIYIFI
jgi:hypothetical protein